MENLFFNLAEVDKSKKELKLGFISMSSKLICQKEVVAVMCRNDQETDDHLIDVVSPATRGGWISIELSMESQLFCETIG